MIIGFLRTVVSTRGSCTVDPQIYVEVNLVVSGQNNLRLCSCSAQNCTLSRHLHQQNLALILSEKLGGALLERCWLERPVKSNRAKLCYDGICCTSEVTCGTHTYTPIIKRNQKRGREESPCYIFVCCCHLLVNDGFYYPH